MKQKRILALLLVMTFVFAVIQPAGVSAYAAKNFTYAEQKTGATVTKLFLEPGQQVDLKFIGVKDYKNYDRKWTSSDEAVATVDSDGLITARSSGTTTIKLMIGDGNAYISSGVTVTVGKQNTVALGTSGSNTFSTAELILGKTMDLGFYGMLGWDTNRYTCAWVSTNPAAATVDQQGIVTPVAEGRTFIMLLITDKFTTSSLTVTPVVLNIVKQASPPTAPTSTPTPKPGVTVTPTPMPELSSDYTVTLQSLDSVLVKFPSKASYEEEDISLTYVFDSNGDSYESDRSFEISWNSAKTEATITPHIPFADDESYIVRFGAKDSGTRFDVKIGTPNRLEIVYACLGAEGVAYAQTNDSIDVPVTLSYKLYYNNIDITEEYEDFSYVDFELIAPEYSDDFDFYGEELVFYKSRVTAQIRATLYYQSGDKELELKSNPVSITSKSLGTYTIKDIEEWTIVDSTETSSIDWENPVHSVKAGTSNTKLVLLIKDSYGTRYSTDDRGVDEDEEIYSLTDETKMFGANGYELEFSTSNMDDVYVDYDGSFSTYEAASKVYVYVKLLNIYEETYRETSIGSITMKILAPSELSSIQAESKSVTLITECRPGDEMRLCETDVNILFFDQYSEEWAEGGNLEVSCNDRTVDAVLGDVGSPAYINGNTLHINAKAIRELTERTSVTFTVTEVDINKKATISVSLKTPTFTDGEVAVTSWAVGTENVDLSFDENDGTSKVKYAVIELFQLGKSGLKVGKYPDQTNSTKVTLVQEINYTPKAEECNVGDIFVMVIGPDGKALPVVGENELGIYWDSTNKSVRLNVAAPENGSVSTLSFLATGRYNVRAIKVTAIDGTKVSTQSKTAYLTVTDNVSTIKLAGTKGSRSEISVSSQSDISSVAAIIEELFVFTQNGKELKVTADMISDVTFTWKEKSVVIKGMELLIPAGNNSGMNYRKTIKFSNKSVFHSVDNN